MSDITVKEEKKSVQHFTFDTVLLCSIKNRYLFNLTV